MKVSNPNSTKELVGVKISQTVNFDLLPGTCHTS